MRSPTTVPAAIALALLLAPGRATAQCTYCGIPILQLAAGARPLALGGAYVAGGGPDAIFFNPAQVGDGKGTTINATRIGGSTIGEFATIGRLASFALGAGVRFSSRALSASMADDLGEGAVVAGIAAATETHGISLGGSASFVTDDLAASTGGAVYGAGASVRALGLRLGVSAQNIGADQGPNRLPTTLALGAMLPGISLGTFFDLSAAAELDRERDGALFPRGGVELSYEPVSGWTAVARVGARRAPLEPGRLPQSAIVLGGSFGLDRVTLDYAFSPPAGGGRATHSLGLRIE